jgi:hypothetical protein
MVRLGLDTGSHQHECAHTWFAAGLRPADTPTFVYKITAMSKFQDPADLHTWWILYLGCGGLGFSNVKSQLCNFQQRLLCLAQTAELRLVEVAGSKTLLEDNSRYLCLQSGIQLIPTKPFIEFLGFRVCGPQKSSGRFFIAAL